MINGINLEKIFEYPILPEAPCFAHPLGTAQAAIHHYMIKDQNFQSPNNVETAVYRRNVLLKSSLSKLPGKLSAIAKLILQKALSLTKHQGDICFDVFTSPSAKDVKWRTRRNINSELTLSFGSGMKTPTDIFNLLKLNDFKKELLRFFVTKYDNDEYAVILGNKVL